MNQLRKAVVVLDACVLFPAPIRDLLLHCAAVDLFQPKWTSVIHDEWKRNLLKTTFKAFLQPIDTLYKVTNPFVIFQEQLISSHLAVWNYGKCNRGKCHRTALTRLQMHRRISG